MLVAEELWLGTRHQLDKWLQVTNKFRFKIENVMEQIESYHPNLGAQSWPAATFVHPSVEGEESLKRELAERHKREPSGARKDRASQELGFGL